MRLNSGEHEAEAREKLMPRAEREVRANILLEHLSSQLAVEVEDEEPWRRESPRLWNLQAHRPIEPEGVFRAIRKSRIPTGQLQRSQTLEKLVESAEITEVHPIERSLGVAQVCS